MSPGEGRGAKYSVGIGALTGGLISASYLVYVFSVLPDPADFSPVAGGLVAAFLGATLVNTLVAALIIEMRHGNLDAISDYGAGAVIGTVVTFLTVISFIFNTT